MALPRLFQGGRERSEGGRLWIEDLERVEVSRAGGATGEQNAAVEEPSGRVGGAGPSERRAGLYGVGGGIKDFGGTEARRVRVKFSRRKSRIAGRVAIPVELASKVSSTVEPPPAIRTRPSGRRSATVPPMRSTRLSMGVQQSDEGFVQGDAYSTS